MTHLSRRLALTLGLLGTVSGAGAIQLDIAATASSAASAQLRFGVREYQAGSFTLGAGLSTSGADLSATRALVLPGVGTARAQASAGVLWSGGLRGALNLSGTAGPVALTLGLNSWTAALERFDPLARWAEAAPDLRSRGFSAGVTARYRLRRDLLLNLDSTLGGQSSVLVGAEFRRDALSYRLGARVGQQVLAVSAGVSYVAESGLTVVADALYGSGTLGLSGSLELPDRLGDGSDLRLYVAYEPWRTVSEPLRYGVQANLSTGPGTLLLELRGGQSVSGQSGFGGRVQYTLPLGEDAEQP
ncbi:hypothetical protein [Deinococcus sonorensis]|uniref:Uncharacterized protein n=2 Tax=Deinococcus sonorensis TaxID=309891 RepID=A0AAU7UAB7_9DEIO